VTVAGRGLSIFILAFVLIQVAPKAAITKSAVIIKRMEAFVLITVQGEILPGFTVLLQ